MLRVQIDVVGLAGVQEDLSALRAALQDVRPFWHEVFAPTYFALVQDLFATGGRSRGEGGRFSGGAWAALSPRYRAWKDRHVPGKPILERTGALRDSVRWTGRRLGPGGIFDAQPAFAVIGTRVPYGAAHQTGTARLPARPFLPTPDPAVFGPLLKAWLLRTQRRPRV